MFRGLLILTSTVIAVIAMLVGVVGFGLHKIAAAQHEADVSWHPPDASTALATTNPAVEPIMATDNQPAALPQSRSIELLARDATLHGAVQLIDGKAPARVEPTRDDRGGKRGKWRGDMASRMDMTRLSGFSGASDSAEWPVELPKAGEYEIDLDYACPKWGDAGSYLVTVGGKELEGAAEASRYDTNFRVMTLGKLTLPAGKTKLTIHAAGRKPNQRILLTVRSIHLIPTTD